MAIVAGKKGLDAKAIAPQVTAPEVEADEKPIMKLSFTAEEIKAYSSAEQGSGTTNLPIDVTLYPVKVREDLEQRRWANTLTPMIELSNGMVVPKLMLLGMVVHDDSLIVNAETEVLKAIIHTGNRVTNYIEENPGFELGKFTIVGKFPKAINADWKQKKEDYEKSGLFGAGVTYDDLVAEAETRDGVTYIPSIKSNRFGAFAYSEIYSIALEE